MNVAPKPAEQCKGIYLINGWFALSWLAPLSKASVQICLVLCLIRTSSWTDIFRKGTQHPRTMLRHYTHANRQDYHALSTLQELLRL